MSALLTLFDLSRFASVASAAAVGADLSEDSRPGNSPAVGADMPLYGPVASVAADVRPEIGGGVAADIHPIEPHIDCGIGADVRPDSGPDVAADVTKTIGA